MLHTSVNRTGKFPRGFPVSSLLLRRTIAVLISMEGKIDKRNGGCGVIFENKLYVWGGESVDKYNLLAELSSEEEEEEGEGRGEKEEDEDSVVEIVVTLPRPDDPDHPFDVFNMDTHLWSRQPTCGDPPSLGLGSTLNVHLPSRCFYLFGGWNERQFDSEVYRVPVDTWVWEKVCRIHFGPLQR